ncbi:MAG: hypothetical protein U0Q16_31810 [Bryobacteraceae bacterium]
MPEQPAWRRVLAQADGDAPAGNWLRRAVEAVNAFGEEKFCAESSAWLREVAGASGYSGNPAALTDREIGELKAVVWYGTVSRCLELQQATLGLLTVAGHSSAALAWTVAQYSPETAASTVITLRRELGLSDVAAVSAARDAFDGPPASGRLQ